MARHVVGLLIPRGARPRYAMRDVDRSRRAVEPRAYLGFARVARESELSHEAPDRAAQVVLTTVVLGPVSKRRGDPGVRRGKVFNGCHRRGARTFFSGAPRMLERWPTVARKRVALRAPDAALWRAVESACEEDARRV